MAEEKEILYEFSFPEYELQQRGMLWYVIAGTVIALLVVYAVVTANYLFALVVVLLSGVLALRDFRAPAQITFQIAEDALYVDGKRIPYSDVSLFWLIYEPPLFKNLHVTFSTMRPSLRVPLLDVDPVELRTFFRTKVKEDMEKRTESPIDIFAKILKL